jgi:ABC-2 type transport system permease protein
VFIAGVRGACAREIAYLRTHPWDLALISWFPALLMTLAWAIFAQGVNVKLPLALVDEDHSPGSRRFAVALEATRSTNIAARPITLEDAWPLVRARQVYAVVHVPTDWERRSQRGNPLPVVLYTNEQYHARDPPSPMMSSGPSSRLPGGER